MKYTHLLGATVLAVALGTQGLATVTTNDVASQNFDGLDTTGSVLVTNHISALNLGNQVGTWYADNEDASEIIAGPISATTSVGAAAGEAKHLELKTEGKELKWEPGTMTEEQTKALIEMKVRLVASDTVPSMDTSDTSVHAAVYLFESETNKADIALYAYVYDPNTGAESNLWVKIADPSTAGCSGLTNGCMMALRVLMDYTSKAISYEGAVISNPTADPVYYPLALPDDDLQMSNATTAGTGDYKTLKSIAFRGTGGVDDLFVKGITETPSTAYLQFELWDDADLSAPVEPLDLANPITDTLDTEELGARAGTGFEADLTGLVTRSVELFDITEGTNSCTWTENHVPELAANGNIEVSMANFTFVHDHVYLVKVTVGEPVVYRTVSFVVDGVTNSTASVVNGQTVSAPDPAPTKNGWVFKGWTLNGAAYSFSTPVIADIELVASWKQLFTVTFDANGHGTTPAAQSVEDGATATEPEALTAEGYTFNGWTLSGSAYSFSTPVTGNITLVADWSEASSAEGVEFGSFVIVDDVNVTNKFTNFTVSGSTITVTMSAKVQSTGKATSETFYATYDTTLGGGQGYTLAAQSVTGVEGTPGTVTATFTLPADNAAFFTGFTNTANPKPSANE